MLLIKSLGQEIHGWLWACVVYSVMLWW